MKTALLTILVFFFLDAFSQETQLISDVKKVNESALQLMSKSVITSVLKQNKQKSFNGSFEENFGYAEIKATDYNFSFLLFPGWYWETTDEYTSFYVIDQKYNDFGTFGAYFSLYVYRNSTSALSAATSDLNVANSYDPVIYQDKTETTFAGQTAYWNSYSYEVGTLIFHTDTWSFSYMGVTYKYKIFAISSDWDLNKDMYLDMTNGFTFFSNSTNAIQPVSGTNFFVKTYPNPTNGEINFESNTNLKSYTVSNLAGQVLYNKNIDDLDGYIDISGLAKGYYIFKFESSNGDMVRKIQLIK